MSHNADCPVFRSDLLACFRPFMTELKSIDSYRNDLVTRVGGILCAILVQTLALGQDLPKHRVELVSVAERKMSTVLNVVGSLEPFRSVNMSSRGQGQIVSMPVREGGWVDKGDILFEMDRRADLIALKRAEAELLKSELELGKLVAGSRPEEIEEATRRLAASEAVRKAAEEEWKRVQKLAEQGIAAASELGRARSEFDVSQAQYSQAKARLALIAEGTRSEEVLIAEAEVSIRRVVVEEIQRRLSNLTVSAPFAGVISQQNKEVGEWASPGDLAMRLMVMNPMKLRISVPQKYISAITPEQIASVTIPGLNDSRFKGRVIALIPQASEGSRNFPVLLELENPERLLSAGMYAKVSLILDEGGLALVVPRTALQYRKQQMVVYRFHSQGEQKEGTVEEIPIEVSQELEGEIVIAPLKGAGLRRGDHIVLMGGSKLKNGDRVRVLPSASQSSSLGLP